MPASTERAYVRKSPAPSVPKSARKHKLIRQHLAAVAVKPKISVSGKHALMLNDWLCELYRVIRWRYAVSVDQSLAV